MTCKRCGCAHVHWMQRRNGSWYLAYRAESVDGRPDSYTAKVARRPHVCNQCGSCRVEAL